MLEVKKISYRLVSETELASFSGSGYVPQALLLLDDDVEVLVDRVQDPQPLFLRLLRRAHHRT